jgi:hypothetical protein
VVFLVVGDGPLLIPVVTGGGGLRMADIGGGGRDGSFEPLVVRVTVGLTGIATCDGVRVATALATAGGGGWGLIDRGTPLVTTGGGWGFGSGGWSEEGDFGRRGSSEGAISTIPATFPAVIPSRF